MAADRAQHVAEVIEPALVAGSWVVTDRYSGSTFAYQGYGRGLDLSTSWSRWSALRPEASPPTSPCCSTCPLDVARQRRSGSDPDRFEGEDEAFLGRVAAGFSSLAAGGPGAVGGDRRDRFGRRGGRRGVGRGRADGGTSLAMSEPLPVAGVGAGRSSASVPTTRRCSGSSRAWSDSPEPSRSCGLPRAVRSTPTCCTGRAGRASAPRPERLPPRCSAREVAAANATSVAARSPGPTPTW